MLARGETVSIRLNRAGRGDHSPPLALLRTRIQAHTQTHIHIRTHTKERLKEEEDLTTGAYSLEEHELIDTYPLRLQFCPCVELSAQLFAVAPVLLSLQYSKLTSP